jgi:monovalent cation:H+ antiporter-2, CPA2 family
VLAQDALRRNLLPEPWFDPIVLASVLTLLATPYLFPFSNWIANQSAWLRLPAAEQVSGPTEEKPDAVVVGYGPAGEAVTSALLQRGWRVTVVEANPDLVSGTGLESVVVGDATTPEILVHAGIREVKGLILTVPDPRVVRMVTNLAQTLAPQATVIVRARYHRFLDALKEAGAAAIVDEETLVGQELARRSLEFLGAKDGSLERPVNEGQRPASV